MDIKTITCHDVYNYGATLQAFALQDFLEQMGHNVEIINYKPNYIDFPYKVSLFVHPSSPMKKYTEKYLFLKILYAIKRYLWYIPSLSRKKSFDSFIVKHLRITKKYSCYSELINDIPNADLYIVGSDQVWNSVTMLNGLDPAFYLQFVPKNKRKISYSASFGFDYIPDRNKDTIKLWLSTLDAISVREVSGVNILREFKISSEYVCDPVFLLSKKDWIHRFNIAEDNEKYVLIYNLSKIDANLIKVAKIIADHFNYKLYSVSPMKIRCADRCFINAGPDKFISLIFNAAFVVTNSFHATAFSIIFRRQFCSYNYHSKGNSCRMFSILSEMGMLDRFNVVNVESILNNPINYTDKEQEIAKFCLKGKNWLIKNIY